jgi:hypothetical protein
MEESVNRNAPKSAPPISCKRPYEPPRLIRYGDVAHLTEAVVGSIDDILSLGMKDTGQVG